MKFGISLGLLFVIHSIAVVDGSTVRKDCVCGKANIVNSGRIVNGTNVTRNKWPWIAAMFVGDAVICGGAVISDRNILTAGHCYYYTPYPYATRWALGMHSQVKRDGRFYTIEDYQFHPNFINYTIYDDYDLTIVRLHGRIKFNLAIQPICFNDVHDNYFDLIATVAGWGRLDDSLDEMADELRETRVQVKSNKFCADASKGIADFNTQSMICAFTKNTDSCQGDSGGPLFIETHPNRYEIIGVVSFGDGCARDFPGIYTKTANAETQKWIKNYIIQSKSNVCSDSAGKVNDFWFSSG